jgi:excisionase family DNA binding protein
MATTRNKGKAANATVSSPPGDSIAGLEVLTLAEAAAYLRLSDEDVVRLVREQALPGRRIDREWRFLKAALQEWLRSPSPALQAQEDLMQWAGAFRDDPELDEIVREAYRQRGRPITPEGE